MRMNIYIRNVLNSVRELVAPQPYIHPDIAKIELEIAKKRAELDSHRNSQKNGALRCKKEDDAFYENDEKLCDAMFVLRDRLRGAGIERLNAFPLNTPCTIDYVMQKVGIDCETMSYILITNYDYDTKFFDNYGTKPHLKTRKSVRVVSDTEIVIYSHNALACDQYRCKIKLTNWRFVESKDSSIFYVKRFE